MQFNVSGSQQALMRGGAWSGLWVPKAQGARAGGAGNSQAPPLVCYAIRALKELEDDMASLSGKVGSNISQLSLLTQVLASLHSRNALTDTLKKQHLFRRQAKHPLAQAS